MYGTKELREHLRQKLDIGQRQLRRLIADKAAELPSTNEQALFVLAHENGMKLSNYLTREQIGEVRGLVQGRPVVTAASRKNGRARVAGKSSPRPVSVTIKGIDSGKLKIPALKPSHADAAKQMAERVYPRMYLFENSVRDLIELMLKDIHGKDWWTKAVPTDVQNTAAKHKASEKKEPWHGQRGAREIDYVYLSDLWAIINRNWTDFKDLFPKKAWVESLITSDMNVSRNVIAHMNPLGADDVRNIETAYNKWVKQLQAVEDKLP
jgi:hypothetical protein